MLFQSAMPWAGMLSALTVVSCAEDLTSAGCLLRRLSCILLVPRLEAAVVSARVVGALCLAMHTTARLAGALMCHASGKAPFTAHVVVADCATPVPLVLGDPAKLPPPKTRHGTSFLRGRAVANPSRRKPGSLHVVWCVSNLRMSTSNIGVSRFKCRQFLACWA